MKHILINIDLNFSFESVNFGLYVCNTLPDKIITIDLTEPEIVSYNQDPCNNSITEVYDQFYIYKTVFKSSGISFSYKKSKENIGGLRSFNSEVVIRRNISDCLLNHISEEDCKKVLDLFKPDDIFIFSKYNEGLLPQYTIDTINNSRHFIYDKNTDILYIKSTKYSGKFAYFLDYIIFSSSYFNIYESFNNEHLKINIFHRLEDKYISITYSENQLSVVNFINNTHEVFVGDDIIANQLSELIKSIVVETPNAIFTNHLKDFNLDFSSKNDLYKLIDAIYMAHY